MDHIQYKDQSKDAVDVFHQLRQSLHSPLPLPGSTFHSVTLGSFHLYAVCCWRSHYFSYAYDCLCFWSGHSRFFREMRNCTIEGITVKTPKILYLAEKEFKLNIKQILSLWHKILNVIESELSWLICFEMLFAADLGQWCASFQKYVNWDSAYYSH